MATDTPVLIVGGGLSGLTSAMLLARQDVRCVLVERHSRTSIQYKFAGISPRSMEIFREAGLEEDIRANRTGDQQAGGVARGRTLSDPAIEWMMPSAWPGVDGLGPADPATCDQHVLEPILRAEAARLGADVRFGTELVSCGQDPDGVNAVVVDRASNTEQTIRAQYLIAADGASGTLRDRLGIGRSGPGVLQHWMNIIFDTDLSPYLLGKRFTSCFVTDLNATFTPRESGRWLLALQYDAEHGERPESFDEQRCRELVRKGAGQPDVRADLLDAREWEVAACIADRFREQRAFLVGDAAHLMPPTGAFGGNTGIHDAHNLAWKLAFVVKGAAGPALLDSYDAERRPVAAHTLEQALARLQAWFKDPQGRLPEPVEMVDGYDVVFGQRYRDGAILAEGDDPDRPFAVARDLSGQPGTRAPHLVVESDSRRLSILDLFGGTFVLLTGAGGSAWCEAIRDLSARLPLSFQCYRIGDGGDLGDVDGEWPDRYGVTNGGAVLVRPDGFVAWRAREMVEDAGTKLREVTRRLHIGAN